MSGYLPYVQYLQCLMTLQVNQVLPSAQHQQNLGVHSVMKTVLATEPGV